MTEGRLAALRSRDFRLLFVGQLVSLTGSQMQHGGGAWQIYKLTDSSLALGLLGLCRVVAGDRCSRSAAASSPMRSIAAA